MSDIYNNEIKKTPIITKNIEKKESVTEDSDNLYIKLEENNNELENQSESITGAEKGLKDAEKKEKRPSRIELKDKSELFKTIIDIALSVERIEGEKKKNKEKIKTLNEECKNLKEDVKSLTKRLEAAEQLCDIRQQTIDSLVSDVNHRNEVIDIIKADKSESSQEFKNSLAASLKVFKADYDELNSMEMTGEVGTAMADTIDSIFKILEKNDIHIQ